MALIAVEFQDQSVLQHRASDLSSALDEIGEDLKHSTRQRFDTSTAPDGRRWAPISATAQRLQERRQDQRQRYRLRHRQAPVDQRNRARGLANTIDYQVLEGHTLLVGNPLLEDFPIVDPRPYVPHWPTIIPRHRAKTRVARLDG